MAVAPAVWIEEAAAAALLVVQLAFQHGDARLGGVEGPLHQQCALDQQVGGIRLLGDGALDQRIGFGVFLDAAGLDELAEEVMQFLGIG